MKLGISTLLLPFMLNSAVITSQQSFTAYWKAPTQEYIYNTYNNNNEIKISTIYQVYEMNSISTQDIQFIQKSIYRVIIDYENYTVQEDILNIVSPNNYYKDPTVTTNYNISTINLINYRPTQITPSNTSTYGYRYEETTIRKQWFTNNEYNTNILNYYFVQFTNDNKYDPNFSSSTGVENTDIYNTTYNSPTPIYAFQTQITKVFDNLETFDPTYRELHYYTKSDIVISYTVEIQPEQYEVIDIPGLMFTILGMPFAWLSTAFNLTIFPGTPYAINLSHVFWAIIGSLILIYIIKKVIK